MSNLRDPRTFRVVQRPGAMDGGGLHFHSDDTLLARIYDGEKLPADERPKPDEHYYPGDLIEGRLPVRAVDAFLANGQIVEAFTEVDPFWEEGDSRGGSQEQVPDEPAMTDAAAERLAEAGIDPRGVRGTGKGGRITAGDVDAHLAALVEPEELNLDSAALPGAVMLDGGESA